MTWALKHRTGGWLPLFYGNLQEPVHDPAAAYAFDDPADARAWLQRNARWPVDWRLVLHPVAQEHVA
jgi:hypothetical protein